MATEGLVQHGFAKMGAFVLNLNILLLMNICTNMNICTSKPPLRQAQKRCTQATTLSKEKKSTYNTYPSQN